MFKLSKLLYIGLIGLLTIGYAKSKASHKIYCKSDVMQVDIGLSPYAKNNKSPPHIYLEGLNGYPDIRCQPNINETLAVFRLSLKDFYECGVTRMINKITGKTVYYHKIIIDDQISKETVSVKCITSGLVYNALINETYTRSIVRRDVLPAGFQEPEDLEITTDFTEHAPEPILGVGVRQGGNVITGELNVSPGTPLSMEIYLDKASSPVYGLGVTYMQVTDTKAQEETIVFNGCSVDSYLFENFNTVDGDFLTAKFRAFKFPESTYVQFRATVNVCLDKCQGTPCSNGQIGYGRRKRREVRNSSDPNKIYEISMATFIKVSDVDGINKSELIELEEKLRQLKIANQRLARNSRGSFFELAKPVEQIQTDLATVIEQDTLLKMEKNSAIYKTPSSFPIIFISVTLVIIIKHLL